MDNLILTLSGHSAFSVRRSMFPGAQSGYNSRLKLLWLSLGPGHTIRPL